MNRCRECNKPLIRIAFKEHYRLQCDKAGCHLFGESQGVIPKGKGGHTKKLPKKAGVLSLHFRNIEAGL